MKHLLSDFTERFLRDLKAGFGTRNNPEVLYFYTYIRSIAPRLPRISQRAAIRPKALLIPATNGGTISVLVAVLLIEHEWHVTIRVPSGGFDGVTQVMFDQLLSVAGAADSQVFRLVDDKDLNSDRRHSWRRVFAWGSDQTEAVIKKRFGLNSRDLLFFGSKASVHLANEETINAQTSKQAQLYLESTVRDILTFDQTACTATKCIVWSGSFEGLQGFLGRLDCCASQYSARRTQEINSLRQQQLVSLLRLCRLYGCRRILGPSKTGFRTLMFAQVNGSHVSVLDLDRLEGGTVAVVLVDDLPSANQFIEQLGTSSFVVGSEKNSDALVGHANDLRLVWDGIDLLDSVKIVV